MEQELWAHMWTALIEGGGDWLDYRLLASAERTNPWQQGASSRMIRAGDLVVFDCGMAGPFSYGADISRQPDLLINFTPVWRMVWVWQMNGHQFCIPQIIPSTMRVNLNQAW